MREINWISEGWKCAIELESEVGARQAGQEGKRQERPSVSGKQEEKSV